MRKNETRRVWSLLKRVLFVSIILHACLIVAFLVLDFLVAADPPGHYQIMRMVGLVGGFLVEIILFSCIS